MECWTEFPAPAVDAVVKGVSEIELVRKRRLEEIKEWRAEMLVNILEALKTQRAG